MARVAVVGGGLAGLSAAYTLRRSGHEVIVFEASDRLGGKIYTHHVDELLIDAGPDSFLSSKPAALQLVEQLGLSDRVINTLPDGGGTFILRNGKLMPLPEGITLLVPAEFRAIARTPLLSPLGKLRIAMDYVIPRRKSDEDESVGSFVRRRVGREAFERMAEPLLSGIHAGDANRLSLLSTFPRLREIEREHGSVIKGAIAQRRQARLTGSRPGARRTPFVSLAGGLGELSDALARQIGVESIRLDARVNAVAGDDTFVVHADGASSEQFDAVIIAAPAWAAATMLEPIDTLLADALRQIEYVSTATVSLAFRAADVAARQSGRGFVIPRAEGRTLTAVTWTSIKFGGRAPEGLALLRGFVGRAGNEEPAFLPDEELLALVRNELHAILGINADPVLARIYRWPRALPQYNLGHQDRLRAIDERLADHPGLVLTGAAYRGLGIPDVIRDAVAQAESLAATLAGQPVTAGT